MSYPESLFSADIVHNDGSVILAIVGELDLSTAPILRRAVEAVLDPHLRAVTLDLAAMTFVDIVGLRALVEVKRAAERLNAEFRLRAVSGRTLRVIRIAGFVELEDETERVRTTAR